MKRGTILIILIVVALLVGVYVFQSSTKQDVKLKDSKEQQKIIKTVDDSEEKSLIGIQHLKMTKLATIPEQYYVDPSYVVFSPDGRKVAYIAFPESREDCIIFVGDKSYGTTYCIHARGGGFAHKPIFSTDSRKVAYAAIEDKKEFVVVDSGEQGRNEGKRYRYVSDLVFSRDGKTVAYRATDGNEEFIVVGDKEGKRYVSVHNLMFSPGGDIAYGAEENRKRFLVIGNNESKRYDSISSPIFSHDGQKVAYIATENGKSFVTVENRNGERKEGKRYAFVVDIVFSPIGEVAYVAHEDDGAGYFERDKFIVVGDKEDKRNYDRVENTIFSPNSRNVTYKASKNGEEFVVNEGHENQHYDGVWDITFSPDGKKIAYMAALKSELFLVIDGKEGKNYEEIDPPVFSPDSKAIAYVAHKADRGVFVVIDDKEGKAYDRIWPPIFSPDSKFVAYGAQKGNELWWIVDPVPES